jgi:outer membrane biosynthesis protein TonB
VRSDDPAAQPPKCENCPPVLYPDIAKDSRVAAEGMVELLLLVDERGAVTILDSAYRSLPTGRAAPANLQRVFIEAAASRVKKWLYRPARKDGVAVRMKIRAIVEFRLAQ